MFDVNVLICRSSTHAEKQHRSMLLQHLVKATMHILGAGHNIRAWNSSCPQKIALICHSMACRSQGRGARALDSAPALSSHPWQLQMRSASGKCSSRWMLTRTVMFW